MSKNAVEADLGFFEDGDGRGTEFAQVVGGNLGGHADGDAGRPVGQEHG